MESLLILLALAVLALPIGVILLWIGQSRLRSRADTLERQVSALQAQLAQMPPVFAQPPVPAAPPAPQTAAPVVEPTVAPAPQPAAETPPPMPTAAPSPWERAMGAPASSAPPIATTPPADGLIVLRADRFAALARWLQKNWVYAVSALSLALAGVFFVQYGIEKGLLPPTARVALAILFGAALIVGGEFIRRRWGDEGDTATAYLPSVFSGAGLVSIFAGIVAGRLMYGLYGAEVTFTGLVVTAALAVWLGWRHGPLLVAIGLLGAAAAPFLVASGQGPTHWLYGYYAIITAAGLGVDAIRRWAWVSVLALALGFGGGYLMLAGGAGEAGFALLLLALAALAMTLPELRLMPAQDGPSLLQALIRRDGIWPAFPVRLAAGSVLAASLLAYLTGDSTDAMGMIPALTLTALALALLLWAHRAQGLADLALIPTLGFLVRLALDGWDTMGATFRANAIGLRPLDASAPLTVTLLLGMAVALSIGFAMRALRRGDALPYPLALGAVLAAPIAALILELTWTPALVLGVWPWALHVMALAAAMVALAVRFAATDAPDRRRAAWATLSALSLIALALFLIATKAALTLALAALVLTAAALDRRYKLPEMDWFIQLGVAVLSYRLIVDPGLDWALEAGLVDVLLAFLGVLAGLYAALRLLPEGRILPKGVLESAIAGFAALLANVLIHRWLATEPTPDNHFLDWTQSHWAATLDALPWLIVMLVQLYRLPLGGVLKPLRIGIAAVAGALAFGGLALAVGPFNPLFSYSPDWVEGLIYGPPILDTLFLAYAVPALMLLTARRSLPLHRRLSHTFAGIGAALLALYAVLEIRRFWEGDFIGGPTMSQGELYSYTLALMLLGAALLYQAIAKRSALLQRVAMGVIGLTVAKVFLIDAAGLTGLTRVVSFLGLGLSLAGLAWLNAWARGVMGTGKKP